MHGDAAFDLLQSTHKFKSDAESAEFRDFMSELSANERKQFAEFPLELDGWKGRQGFIEQIYLDALKLTDYSTIPYVMPVYDK